ncbi:hypothetical protein [Komagataeibacter sp. FNDCR2]|uniref:hypothetical protein n=1 Tax=Komagataeibacter sp. FNDCR2 TaxID=2878682 RepID=UPI001E37A95B|nr:hypothetical protein [Komagataeibacter sp. FNDCR2]MCE2574790.1 hypothetical protein [Komagataeibacter sp. FNDCR2]
MQPLSEQLNCPVDLTWALHQEQEFGAVLSTMEGTSLVCWQHQGLAPLTRAIVAPQQFPGLHEWPSGCYDRIWWLHRSRRTMAWRITSYRMTGPPDFLLQPDETNRLPP